MFRPFRKKHTRPATVPNDPDIVVVRQSDPLACGGTDATRDLRAPQTIASDNMILFHAASALSGGMMMGAEQEKEPPLGYVEAFAAPAAEGCFLYLDTAYNHQSAPHTIRWALVRQSIFPALAALARELELAKGNGYHSTTHGLPENFGGRVYARYAEGDVIDYSDNQTPVLSPVAARRIADLFARAMQGPAVTLPDPADVTAIDFEELRADGGFTRATLTLQADGAGVNAKQSRYDDPTVYTGEKPVDAETVAALRQTIARCGMLAWPGLPAGRFAGTREKSLTFTLADGRRITVPDGLELPSSLGRGFFAIELEMTTKH